VSVEPWPIADGIVEFPNGVRVRGRGLGRDLPPGPDPTVGIYLLARTPPAVAWPSEWIKWPDFRLPSDPLTAVRTLTTTFASANSARLEVACDGGRGRTGTALAILAIASGVDPARAVNWVRENYHRNAVETPWQRRWIEKLNL
jgi:hypothetical protein